MTALGLSEVMTWRIVSTRMGLMDAQHYNSWLSHPCIPDCTGAWGLEVYSGLRIVWWCIGEVCRQSSDSQFCKAVKHATLRCIACLTCSAPVKNYGIEQKGLSQGILAAEQCGEPSEIS